MRLVDIVKQLASFDAESTIYAEEPWTEESEAIVEAEPDSGGVVPERVQRLGCQYFVEVFLAREFLEAWLAGQERKPTLEEMCRRLIDYAANDA